MVLTPIIRFLIVGGLAAVVNVVARIAFNTVTSYEVAIVLAFPIALTVAFILNRIYVFTAVARDSLGQYVRFAMVNLLALLQVWIVSVFLALKFFPLIAFSWHAETVAHAIGVLSPVATSYLAHKYFTFR